MKKQMTLTVDEGLIEKVTFLASTGRFRSKSHVMEFLASREIDKEIELINVPEVKVSDTEGDTAKP